MAYFDLPIEELRTYRPPDTRQPDFESFWLNTLTEAARHDLNPHLEPMDVPYRGVRMFRASYAGWNSEVVGTYAIPEGNGPFPAVVIFHGYSSRRPVPFELLSWTSQGYEVLAVDVRGQSGESSDHLGYPGGHAPGYMTMGIHDPHHYYYRGVYIDAVRAVSFLAAQPEVDSKRIVVTGASQGGGLTLAVTALCDLNKSKSKDPLLAVVDVHAAVAEIPFLCHFERSATLVDTEPYNEIGRYCRRSGTNPQAAFYTLSYFDCLNLAEYITTPTLVTAGLMDMTCPPSGIFAVYNTIPAPRDIIVSQFGEHETFPGVHEARARWFDHYLQQSV
jgi:cephalosporin-C deacetylase